MTLITEELKAKAEVYYGDELGRETSKFLLEEVGLPRGLLPLRDIIECGYVEETGFVWLKQKKKIEHCFKKIGKQVIYGTEITAYVEKMRIKKLTGVKAKEMMMWLSISDIFVDDPESSTKLVFKNPSGIFRTFPFSAFEEDNQEGKDKEEKFHNHSPLKLKNFSAFGAKVEDKGGKDKMEKEEKVDTPSSPNIKN